MADRPSSWYEAEWKLNQARSYEVWKTVLLKRYMPEDYKQNKQYELSLKVLHVVDDVNQFFDEMQNLFQETDPSMPEDYKVAEIRRANNNIAEYRKFLAVAEADTVQKIRVALTRLAIVDKTEGTVPIVTMDSTGVKFYRRDSWRSSFRDKSSNFGDRNTSSSRFLGSSLGYSPSYGSNDKNYDRNSYKRERNTSRGMFSDRRENMSRFWSQNRSRERFCSRDNEYGGYQKYERGRRDGYSRRDEAHRSRSKNSDGFDSTRLQKDFWKRDTSKLRDRSKDSRGRTRSDNRSDSD